MTLKLMTEENTLKDLEYFIAEMDGIPIAICRYRGKYYAYFDRCSHQGGPACEGSLKEMSKVSFKVMAVTSAPYLQTISICTALGMEWNFIWRRVLAVATNGGA